MAQCPINNNYNNDNIYEYYIQHMTPFLKGGIQLD
jgi:hypothetical protein